MDQSQTYTYSTLTASSGHLYTIGEIFGEYVRACLRPHNLRPHNPRPEVAIIPQPAQTMRPRPPIQRRGVRESRGVMRKC